MPGRSAPLPAAGGRGGGRRAAGAVDEAPHFLPILRPAIISGMPMTGAEDGGGEAEGVEGHVVLAHELDVAHILGALVGAPPALPVGIALPVGVGPFGGAGDVFDGGVEPDVEHLALHPRPGLVAFLAPARPSARSRVMPRSCKPSPSFSHFLAMEVVSIGQSVLLSIQASSLSRMAALLAGRGAWSRAPPDRSSRRSPSAG